MGGKIFMLERKSNPVKKKLQDGKVVFGSCIYSFSPNIMEIAGYCGLDFCRIDNEHAWRQDQILEHLMRAAEISDILPLPRVDKDNPYLIRKVLEIGAGGFIIPDIKDEQEVRAIVRAAKFPPLGERGYSPLCFSGNYAISNPSQWVKWSNEQTLVGVMIETPQAMENLNKIMAVKGLDFVLFGPGDYSIRIGLDEPNKNHPKVKDAIQRTVSAAKKNDKYVMIGVGYPWEEEAQKYIKMGCQMIELGHDYTILSTMWRKMLGKIKVDNFC